MKIVFTTFLFLLGIVQGGGSDDAENRSRQDGRTVAESAGEDRGPRPFGTITGGGDGDKPKIDPRDMPPPKKPFVRDLEVGSGPVARRGDEVDLYYVAVNYRTGKEEYANWPPESTAPFTLRIGSRVVSPAWEKGIEGMRPGGRRELLIPARPRFKEAPLDYVVELVDVTPNSAGESG